MTARLWKVLLFVLGLGLLAAGETAMAACNCTPPPPCCAPPTPPKPPSPPCCSHINIPSLNVNVGATVVVNANSLAISNAAAGAAAGAQASSQVFFGGGGTWSLGESAQGFIQNLQVDGQQQIRRVAYQASRRRERLVVIQAVCIDDRDTPHPASQVAPDREIDEHYEGELYRCIAGTHMQYTQADYAGQVSFEHGQTASCAKGEALWRSVSGEIACRPQAPARDCNERSLLRRFGAGVKIVKIVTVETYTAYRDEAERSATASSLSMSLDGGVGGMVR
jgi:hypothetical protein